MPLTDAGRSAAFLPRGTHARARSPPFRVGSQACTLRVRHPRLSSCFLSAVSPWDPPRPRKLRPARVRQLRAVPASVSSSALVGRKHAWPLPRCDWTCLRGCWLQPGPQPGSSHVVKLEDTLLTVYMRAKLICFIPNTSYFWTFIRHLLQYSVLSREHVMLVTHLAVAASALLTGCPGCFRLNEAAGARRADLFQK